MGIEELLLDRSKQQGEAKGMQKGIRKGKLEGKLEGKHEEAVTIARELKREGLTSEFIAKITRLSVEEIEKL